jgi:TPR repeat protein
MNPFNKLRIKALEKKAHALFLKREQTANINVKPEVKVLLTLAQLYDKQRFNKKMPNAESIAAEYFRAAALLGDAAAQYEFARRYIEKAKFWDTLARGVYGLPIHREYAVKLYDEAFTYLKLAEEEGYPLAIRLQGLVYVNGWGRQVDKEKGYRLIANSIKEEGAWDKAHKIVAALGLDSKEFFASIMALKEGKLL